MTGKRQRCNCSPTTSEAMTAMPCARLLSLTLPLHCTPLGCYTGTTRGDTHEGAGGGGVTERVRGTCGTALWVRWRSVPVARPCQPPPFRDVGWSALTPTFLQSSRSAACRRNGKTVGSSPLLSAGFRISQPPRVRRQVIVAILCWGGWRHASLERRTQTDAEEV
jgi:hypothetical protein